MKHPFGVRVAGPDCGTAIGSSFVWAVEKARGNAKWELYDLSKDLSEKTNLAKSEPERLTELVELWEKMNGEMAEPPF